MNVDTDEDLNCPLTMMLDLISAKWTIAILRELAFRPVRTRQFLQLIPGISMKSLQERIKALQSSGMIERTEYDEKVPRVEHTLTERGKRLFSIMTELKELASEIVPVSCVCSIEGVCEEQVNCHQRLNRRQRETTNEISTV